MQDKANKEAFTSDGWFRTGDQGKFDEDKHLVLTGRIKELINRGTSSCKQIVQYKMLTISRRWREDLAS